MKLIDHVTNWTRRNLRWLLPFVVVMPFVLWWWNSHLEAIGQWLWLAGHGQKGGDIEMALMMGLTVGMVVFLVAEWIISTRKGAK